MLCVGRDEQIRANVHTGAGAFLERDDGQAIEEVVEEIAEKLKGLALIEQPQSQRAAEMGLEDGRGLFKIGQHPRCSDGLFLWFALECLDLRWLQREAPVKIDSTEPRRLIQEGQTVGGEYFGHRIGILRLSWKIETRHDAGVLIETRTFRQS